jgi:hypothetical protein
LTARRQKLVDARRVAAVALGDAKRRRQDVQAAIRRAEASGDEREANRLRGLIPGIERAVSQAARDHDRADRAVDQYDRGQS